MTPLSHRCRECGAQLFQHPGKPAPMFCSEAHRHTFTNRRKSRGAQLVDLAMMNYIERNHPMRRNGDLRRAMDRLLAFWRDEDRAAGRVSFIDVSDLIDCGTHVNPRQERTRLLRVLTKGKDQRGVH